MTDSRKRCTGPNILEMINFCRHNNVLFWCISRPSILFLISALGQRCVSIDLHYLRAQFLPVLFADSFCHEWLVLMLGYVRRQEEKIEKFYKERADWSETSAWTVFIFTHKHSLHMERFSWQHGRRFRSLVSTILHLSECLWWGLGSVRASLNWNCSRLSWGLELLCLKEQKIYL